jgi:hypothetical protein
MQVPDYVQVPQYATLIPNQPADKPVEAVQPVENSSAKATVTSSLPPSTPSEEVPASPAHGSPSGRSAFGNLPGMLLSSALQIPNTPLPDNPRGGIALLSTRDPLSVPITTVNFRRFISKIGAVFWLQDRIEEILLWRKGWKFTATWMAIYTFLCV